MIPTDYESWIEVNRQIATGSSPATWPTVARRPRAGKAGHRSAEEPASFGYLYNLDLSLVDKIKKDRQGDLRGDGIDLSPSVAKQLKRFEVPGHGEFSGRHQTQLSLSSEPPRARRTEGLALAGTRDLGRCRAGYVCAVCDEMRTKPGPPKHPDTERLDIAADGNFVGSPSDWQSPCPKLVTKGSSMRQDCAMVYLTPPARITKIFNKLATHSTLSDVHTLEVARRNAVDPQRVPVIPLEHQGSIFVVSTRDDSEWVKNVRAAGRVRLGQKGHFTTYLATEVPREACAEILSAYRKKAGREVNGYRKKRSGVHHHPAFRLTPV